ncbi:MAG: type I glutamate--ammonia ligase [candidate division WOR-3 bacterium]|nr:type I glutamate--ammonia ligase [candidate division WOR-3 bacterium]
MEVRDILDFIKKEDIKVVDLRFVDILGRWHHISVPSKSFSERDFVEGIGFDGSSIRMWQEIYESDMLLIPDPKSAKVDPFMQPKTLVLLCDVYDPVRRTPYELDPRAVSKKTIEYLKKTDIADTVYIGPEIEFFIFDKAIFEVNTNKSFYEIDSVEARWNTGKEEALGYTIRHKEGYLPVPPSDTLHQIRAEASLILESLGIEVEAFHHEVATGGQGEIDIKYSDLLTMADNVMWYKYVLRNVARKYNKTVTFMPKPIYEDNGSGMHVHISLWKNGENLFYGDEYTNLSTLALGFIAGILNNANTILAFTNPTMNSFKRLVPGYEAPIYLAYSQRNRSASIRVPVYSDNPKSKRVEVRFPDPSSNPYLAFSSILIAGLDGIINNLKPPEPIDKNIYALSEEEREKIPQLCKSLEEALENLSKNRELLTKSGAFTNQLIEKFIRYKYENEVEEYRLRITPLDYYLYYDV